MKSLHSAAIIAAALLTLSACTHKPIAPRFEMIAVDTLIGASPNGYRIAYRFESIANADKSPALQAIEVANIGYFFELEEFSGTAQEAIQQAVGELTRELAVPGGLCEGEVSVEAETFVRDTLLTYIITHYSFTGGAHGIYGTQSHNYSLASGYEYTLSDLFCAQGLIQLDALIRTKLGVQYGAHSDEELAAQGFFPASIAASENFLLTPDGITFYYNPYEIGCYALGMVEVNISREEFEALKNPQTTDPAQQP